MTQKTRLFILIPLTILAFAAVFLGYRHLVQPQQAVWDTKNPVIWEKSQIPLTISSVDYPAALKEAVKLWNGQAKCPLFRVAEPSTITIKQGTIEVDSKTADFAAAAYVSRERDSGEIVVFLPLTVGTDLQVLHHEMGHLLGLAHDRDGTMKPLIKEELDGPLQLVRAQDKDIDALNARYCSLK